MQTRSQAKLSNPPSTSRRQTKPAKTTKTNSISKVDRLSSLPPELLDLIFDYAYPLGSPSTGPLSKHLLPYHVTGTYRRIKLADRDEINGLVRKINREPQLGRLTRSAHLLDPVTDEGDFGGGVEADEIHAFFENLDNLQDLDLGGYTNGSFEFLCLINCQYSNALCIGHLPSLQHLRIAGILELHHFTRFTSLISLDLTQHAPYPFESDLSAGEEEAISADVESGCSLPNLKTLFLYDLSDAGYVTVLPVFFELTPNLRELTLTFAEEEVVDVDWALLVNSLPSNLIELNLFDPTATLPINHLLPRFTQLEHLAIGVTQDSANLSSHLIHLRSLRTLELELEHIPTDQILPLFTGPNHLENLESIIIDAGMVDNNLSGGKAGRKLEVKDDGSIREGTILEEGEIRLNRKEWEVATLGTIDGDIWSLEGGRKVRRAARKKGIRIGGDLCQLLNKAEACLLEIANSVIYRSFRDKNLQYIDYFKALHPDLSRRFPRIDTKTLDPDNLRLVRTDLPLEKWFMLSLSN